MVLKARHFAVEMIVSIDDFSLMWSLWKLCMVSIIGTVLTVTLRESELTVCKKKVHARNIPIFNSDLVVRKAWLVELPAISTTSPELIVTNLIQQ